MSEMEKIHAITNQLFQFVSSSVTKEEREVFLEKVQGYLDTREQYVKSVHPPFSEKDTHLFEQVVYWDQFIMDKFFETKKLIQLDIMELKTKKKSNQKYLNPYQNLSTSDGMFYDKRK
ncbi:hypothetical protein ACNRWW_18765 [Metabacillus sp. HB246100]